MAITYSSKVIRLEFQGVDYTPVTGNKTWTGVRFAEHSTAGWTSTLSPPRVEFTGMGQFFDGQGHPACADVCFPGQNIVGDHYIKRIHVHMPDGSSHELRLDDDAHLFPVEPFTGTFQAVDGSRMRFESNAGAPSVLYLPDGSRYLFGPYNRLRILTPVMALPVSMLKITSPRSRTKLAVRQLTPTTLMVSARDERQALRRPGRYMAWRASY